MTPTQKLKDALASHDSFGAVPDDKQIYVCYRDTLYEFAYEGGALKLGDLRDILRELEK